MAVVRRALVVGMIVAVKAVAVIEAMMAVAVIVAESCR